MFKKFKELFGTESLLDEAMETTLKMLNFDRKMFKASHETLRETDTAELPFDIRSTDRKINKFERQVRRNVLTHLTVAGISNLVPGLALVTIVIDVERIGDYTKNIYGLATRHATRLKGGPWEEDLQNIESTIERNFDLTIEALTNHDKEKGRQVMRIEDATSKLSDGIVDGVLANNLRTLNCASAVALALYVRFLKRINCHLTNISSAVVNPFPRIGFREKISKGQERLRK